MPEITSFTEVFVATHDAALKHAKALEAASNGAALVASYVGAVRIPNISDYEIEQLGDVAGAAVHAGGADFELSMVDVDSDSLLAVPAPMVRVLAELLTYQSEGEGDVLEEVSTTWAGQEDMPFDADAAAGHVRALAKLAAEVDEASRTQLYVFAV
ncbi:hypothetical protein ACQQCD_09580 [Pseudarthrobacter sp. J1763]|uniref:hypothetical protein n=1 Tax=Pseudarthrobacter sp. J1763 TaxID=3420445 RepID=UPI003D2B727A